MRYLVAIDGWEPSHRALAFAAEQAAASGSDLDVVHVVGEGGGDEGANDRIRETVAEAVEGAGVDYEVHFIETDKRTKPANRVGSRLLEFVEERDHDAVFVGNEPTGTAERMIVGSVARTLVDAREVPVVLVP
ncbi:universal stress protein [Halobacteriales archaeon QS_8_69_26]|nr:MAG: universal stress protein [Halobacteriales archaeon QS_8_69_26]